RCQHVSNIDKKYLFFRFDLSYNDKELNMKITGARSVSSLLIVVLTIARYTLGIVLVATVAFVGLALVADIRGLELSVFPPEFGVSPNADANWRIIVRVLVAVDEPRAASASLRVADAQIEGLRGSL